MSNPIRLAAAGDDAVVLRDAARQYLHTVARSRGEEYGVEWAWNSFGLWTPPEEASTRFEEMQWIFGDCSPEDPVTVEILWKSRHDATPAWYRMYIVETLPDRPRPAMRGFWANPATDSVELDDVVAVRPSIKGLPLSCTGVDSPQFNPSTMRASIDPENLLPELTITPPEAAALVDLYLHLESHRVGPLWTTIDAQAVATRDRLLDIVSTTAAAGIRTEINIAVAVRDTSLTQCTHHLFDPPPAYTDINETRTIGLHEVAHTHTDGTVSLEKHGHQHLRAVLSCLALYGGTIHLATVPLEDAAVPVATEVLYRVHYDWRCELVENAEQRDLNSMIATRGRPH
ncbi:hypothetical protein [Nocardia sp. NPDC003963]